MDDLFRSSVAIPAVTYGEEMSLKSVGDETNGLKNRPCAKYYLGAWEKDGRSLSQPVAIPTVTYGVEMSQNRLGTRLMDG